MMIPLYASKMKVTDVLKKFFDKYLLLECFIIISLSIIISVFFFNSIVYIKFN